MGKAIRASALVFLLACSAQAGIMQNETPAPPPPPAPAATSDETTADGYMQTGYMQNDVASPLTQVALDVLAAVSSVL